MNENEIQQLLLRILSSSVMNAEDVASKELFDPDVLAAVYHLAKKHDLSHMLAHYIHRNALAVDKELGKAIQRDAFVSAFRYELMQRTFDEICATFDEMEIPYIPLKGSVIRPYYPVESMRTSCDIDILVHEEDIDAAIHALAGKGYCVGSRNYHDVSLYSPSKIHLELHFSIQENNVRLDKLLKDVWQHAVPERGSCYALKNEFFVFYAYAHMAYHFLSGGCGLRSLMDLWVMEHRMNASYKDAEDLLKRAGIDRFASEMSRIANACLICEAGDDFSQSVLTYIARGGTYGSREHKMAVEKKKGGGAFGYVIRRLFVPYRTLVMLYPVLKKAPILLPFYWIARWVRAIFRGKTKGFVSEVSSANRISDEKASEIEVMCIRLGLSIEGT